jgi:Golgi apparatus protein 1
MVIPCLVEYLDNVTDVNCKAFIKRMRTVVFSDYRLIYKFTDHCQKDIEDFQCGRLQEEDDTLVCETLLVHATEDCGCCH